ncbi:hypothetical protein PIROE2DRAFT_9476 [Piromyces sp. E2]|nr:hypothetical protein PIROE2DRAFT_9476 [Piromyces sp. E2]|eukprot:OUM63876.1 hypothetical protein PIROE2DRAFT_9476 [Piromyces sp. E2]
MCMQYLLDIPSNNGANLVTIKFSYESLMFSLDELLKSDPLHGTNVKFLCPIATYYKVCFNKKNPQDPPYIKHKTSMNCKVVHSNIVVLLYQFIAH